jgi:hypothetical protein
MRAKRIHQIGSVAHESANLRKPAIIICRRDCVTGREKDQLHTPAGKEDVAADEESVGAVTAKTCEGCIDLPAGAGIEHLNLSARGAGSGPQFLHRRLGTHGIGRIDQHGDTLGCGNQLKQNFQPLCRQFRTDHVDACYIAAGLREAGNETELDRVFGKDEDDWHGSSRRLRRECASVSRLRSPVG